MRYPQPLGVILTVAVLAGCQAATGPGESTATAPSVSQQQGDLRLTLSADRAEYDAGESAVLTLMVANTGSTPITLQFTSGYQFDFVAAQAKDVWRYSSGRIYTQALTSITVAPGASVTRSGTWDFTDDAGTPVPSGAYDLRGVVPASPSLGVGSVRLTLR